MDVLSFIASLVESLAWPAVLLSVFIILKDRVLELFPILRKFKYKEFEAEFGETVRELSDKVPSPPVALPPAVAPAGATLRDHLVCLAESAPRAAVLEAWLQVEHAAQRLVQRAGVADRPMRMVGPKIMRQYLDKTAALSQEQRDSFNKLRDLRNKVVHHIDVSLPLDEVIEYIDLALSLAAHFDTLAKASDH